MDIINPLCSFIDAKCRDPEGIMQQIDSNIYFV